MVFYQLSQVAQSLWAKKSSNASLYWLPLFVHMFDTAEVAKILWNKWLSEGVRQVITDDLINSDNAEGLFVFLAAIHDLGKATPIFQAKPAFKTCLDLDECIEDKQNASSLLIKQFRDSNVSIKTPHALATQLLLSQAGCSMNIASILGAHHGKPPSYTLLDKFSIESNVNNYYC